MLEFAKQELDIIGLKDEGDEMDVDMRRHLLHMVEEFGKMGHSGSTASFALGLLTKLLEYKPLTPLIGADDEWLDVSQYGDEPVLQNKRCFSVFKDSDGRVYDVNGIVWYEWYSDDHCSEPYKTYFTNGESHVDVEFPYTPTTEYREWEQSNQAL